MISYIVKEIYFGSAVSEILQYRQNEILLLLYKDYFVNISSNFNPTIFIKACFEPKNEVFFELIPATEHFLRSYQTNCYLTYLG